MGLPGMSRAKITSRTPGMANAGLALTPRNVPWATVDMMGAAYSVPRTSAMSSM